MCFSFLFIFSLWVFFSPSSSLLNAFLKKEEENVVLFFLFLFFKKRNAVSPAQPVYLRREQLSAQKMSGCSLAKVGRRVALPFHLVFCKWFFWQSISVSGLSFIMDFCREDLQGAGHDFKGRTEFATWTLFEILQTWCLGRCRRIFFYAKIKKWMLP